MTIKDNFVELSWHKTESDGRTTLTTNNNPMYKCRVCQHFKQWMVHRSSAFNMNDYHWTYDYKTKEDAVRFCEKEYREYVVNEYNSITEYIKKVSLVKEQITDFQI